MSEHTLAQQQKANTPETVVRDSFSLEHRERKHSEQITLPELSSNSGFGTFAEPRVGFDFSRVPALTGLVRQTQPLLRTQPMLQRSPKDGTGGSSPCPTCPESESTENSEPSEPTGETAPPTETTEPMPEPFSPEGETTPTPSESETESVAHGEKAAPGLIADDSAADLSTGQMRKSEFLAQLRAEVCRAVEAAIAGTGRTTDDCPYLNHWFEFYSRQDSTHIERAIHRYAPEASSITTASEYISVITKRARQSAEIWARTGEITGVPEGIPTNLPGESSTPNGEGGETSTGPLMFKARDGGARAADDPQSIQKELGEGQPLDSGVRSRMESAFGMDFAHVRTHTDSTAAGLSTRMNARAFTVGQHVAFGAHEYKPGTLVGEAIIAHELAHVVQQSSGNTSVDSIEVSNGSCNALEEEADNAAAGVINSLWSGTKNVLGNIGAHTIPRLKSGLRLSRCSSIKPKLSLSNDTYNDTATESHKKIRFDVSVPSCLNVKDYALVNWIKGYMKDGAGNYFRAVMYGSTVNANFSSWQVDSKDTDPVYWSQTGSRWTYTVVPGGFYATDDPGPALNTEHGAVYALNFKIGLYKLSDLPATTSGTISATSIAEKPWEYSVVVDSAGAFTHPAL